MRQQKLRRKLQMKLRRKIQPKPRQLRPRASFQSCRLRKLQAPKSKYGLRRSRGLLRSHVELMKPVIACPFWVLDLNRPSPLQRNPATPATPATPKFASRRNIASNISRSQRIHPGPRLHRAACEIRRIRQLGCTVGRQEARWGEGGGTSSRQSRQTVRAVAKRCRASRSNSRDNLQIGSQSGHA